MYGDDIVKELYEYAVEAGKNTDLVIKLENGTEVDFELSVSHYGRYGNLFIKPDTSLVLQSEVDELESKIENLNDEIVDLSDELAQERNEVSRLEAEIDELRSQLNSHE